MLARAWLQFLLGFDILRQFTQCKLAKWWETVREGLTTDDTVRDSNHVAAVLHVGDHDMPYGVIYCGGM